MIFLASHLHSIAMFDYQRLWCVIISCHTMTMDIDGPMDLKGGSALCYDDYDVNSHRGKHHSTTTMLMLNVNVNG